MSDFMKEREREWKRSIEGDERRVREMDRMIEAESFEPIERKGFGKTIAIILFGYCLPVFLVAGFFIGIAKLWRWILG